MPFLSWTSGNLPRQHGLDEDCLLGRDPDQCAVAAPEEASVSRRHALVLRNREAWWVRDLDSRNGTTLNGLPLNHPQGNALADGDVLRLGDWEVRYSEGFPGLDPDLFAEHIGDIFSEVRREPAQALKLIRGLELLHRSHEALLQETEAMAMVRSLLDQALHLLGAQRGFVAMVGPDRSPSSVHRVGEVEEAFGLSRSVLDYVLVHRTGVLSNAPLADPRFGGMSLMELRRGPLLCAPLDTGNEILGVLYLDRDPSGRPFSRFDLALFQSFVRQGTVALRHDQLARKALGLAEMEGELARSRAAQHHARTRLEELLLALEFPMKWALRLAQDLPGAEALALELGQALALLESARGGAFTGGPAMDPSGEPLAALHGHLTHRWSLLLQAIGARFHSGHAPEGKVWTARPEALLAVKGLVEPLLIQVTQGQEVQLVWQYAPGIWTARLQFPSQVRGPVADSWTARMLREGGVTWRWQDHLLLVSCHEGALPPEEVEGKPLLGLVACGEDLAGFFEEAAEVQSLTLNPLSPDPPLPPVPAHRLVVIDARDLPDPVETVRSYRRNPAFATCPILVLRVNEDAVPDFLGAGATDWLPTGFRWEALHHRLQVLRSHEELQAKARTSERLDSFRMLAGTLKHEINNPLAVMSMQVELLERKYPEEPKLAKIGEMIERIQGLIQVLQKMREATPEAYADGSKILKLN